MDSGHPEEAVAAARASLKSVATRRSTREDLRRMLGSILHHDGRILTQAGLFEEALKAISASINTYRAIIDSGGCPRREIAAALTDQSMVLAKTQQHEKSLVPGEEALQIWRELAAAGSPEDQHCLAAALHNRIIALHGLGRIDEALELLSEHQSLTADSPIT
jgi:tetratricopeptide (TPR) repeat protein